MTSPIAAATIGRIGGEIDTTSVGSDEDGARGGPHRCLGRLLAALVVFAAFTGAARDGETVEVPVEVGTGPAFFQLDRPRFGDRGPIADDQPWHFGWRLEIAAIITREWAREHPEMVPPKHRARLQQLDRVRYSPTVLSLIPRSLIISPKFWNTGIYGSTWEFLHLGFGLTLGRAHLNAAGGLIFTYAFMHSETLSSPFHFVRPGLDLGIDLFVPFSDRFGMSIGWDSHLYIPQTIGGGVLDFGADGPALWHIGETFVMFHYTFPFNYRGSL